MIKVQGRAEGEATCSGGYADGIKAGDYRVFNTEYEVRVRSRNGQRVRVLRVYPDPEDPESLVKAYDVEFDDGEVYEGA